jgi:hypothetical protein
MLKLIEPVVEALERAEANGDDALAQNLRAELGDHAPAISFDGGYRGRHHFSAPAERQPTAADLIVQALAQSKAERGPEEDRVVRLNI